MMLKTKIRTKTSVGDVFSVPLDGGSKKFFQYVANDLTELNSDVIRAFKTAYPIDAALDLNQVVRNDDVDFCAHVVIKWGIKMGLWEKVGTVSDIGEVETLFRASNDYGNPQIRVSQNWRVWKSNQGFQKVGRLEGEHQKAEIGIVVAPPDIVHRMRTGKYDFVYPGY